VGINDPSRSNQVISLRSTLLGLGTMLAVAVPMASQAEAATTTVRLHASTATGESLTGPLSAFGTSESLAPTNVNASRQKWIKTDVGGGFATYKLASTVGLNNQMCLSASVGNTRPFLAICNAASKNQQWSRVFINVGRFDNRVTLTSLTRQPNGTVELRFRGGGQVGQNWHEHAA
jgi:hypothetical protein